MTMAFLIGFPPNNHDNFAGGYEPDVSHLILWAFLMDNRSFGVTILTLEGFTARIQIKIIFELNIVFIERKILKGVFYNRILFFLANTHKELLKELFWNYNRPVQMM